MNESRKLVLGHVNVGTGRHRPFDAVFPLAKEVTPKDIYDGKCDALVIWGGADISPSLYGESVSHWTLANAKLSDRDTLEKDACDAAITTGTPIIGVCRGAQLVCALAGGKLIQHVEGHHETHEITTDEGEIIESSSVHHQMMFPWDVNHKLLAWSTEARSKKYIGETNKDIPLLPKKNGQVIEPEIVWFPKIRALGIQGHPEFCAPNSPFVKHCLKLVRQFITQEEKNGSQD